MIPILYDANVSAKDAEDTSGLGLLSDTARASVTEERNGAYELLLQYPMNGAFFDKIKLASVIKAKPNETDKNQLFRVYRISKPINGLVSFYCEHISYDLNGKYIIAPEFSDLTPKEALSKNLGGNLLGPIECSSDITDRKSYKASGIITERAFVLEMQKLYGGELMFDNQSLSLLKSRGKDSGVIIEYGKNLLTLNQEEDLSELYDMVLAYVTFTAEDPETKERKKHYTSCNVPISSEISGARDQTYLLDLSDRFEAPEEATVEQLREMAEAEIKDKGLGIPKVNLKVSFVQLSQTEEYKNTAELEKVGLCDTVTVRYTQLGVERKVKVIKTVYSPLLERYENIELGDVRDSLADEIVKVKKRVADGLTEETVSEEVRKQIDDGLTDTINEKVDERTKEALDEVEQLAEDTKTQAEESSRKAAEALESADAILNKLNKGTYGYVWKMVSATEAGWSPDWKTFYNRLNYNGALLDRDPYLMKHPSDYDLLTDTSELPGAPLMYGVQLAPRKSDIKEWWRTEPFVSYQVTTPTLTDWSGEFFNRNIGFTWRGWGIMDPKPTGVYFYPAGLYLPYIYKSSGERYDGNDVWSYSGDTSMGDFFKPVSSPSSDDYQYMQLQTGLIQIMFNAENRIIKQRTGEHGKLPTRYANQPKGAILFSIFFSNKKTKVGGASEDSPDDVSRVYWTLFSKMSHQDYLDPDGFNATVKRIHKKIYDKENKA